MPDALAMIIVERTYTRCSNTKQHHTYTPYILMWIRTWIPETTPMRVRRTLHPRYWRDRGKQWAWGKNIVCPSGERGRAWLGAIGMKSSSSSLSLSPGITLGPRELEDPAREVLLVRPIPLAPGRGAIGMKSSSSSLSLSPAITLEPRELDDAAREVLLLRSVPLGVEPSTASPLKSAIPILLFRLLRQPGYTPYQTTYTFLKSEGCLC